MIHFSRPRFLLPAFLYAVFYAGSCQAVDWDIKALMVAPKAHPAAEFQADGLQAVYLEGLPYQGRPTRFAVYYGLPPEAAHGKVPGIVLVHGGKGTAYADWVRLWNARGYAAIAFDHAATLPIGTQSFPPNPQGGPVMHAGGNINDPVADQWMYHAVANAILAHSFLLSLPGVDASRTGITGISWGGVLCDIVPSIDRRFRFAVSVYGTGNISNDHQDGTCFVRPAGPLAERELWRKLWDPANFLERIEIPMLWVTSPNDFAFTLRALRMSAAQVKSPLTVSILPVKTHSLPAGWAPEEIRAFADSQAGKGKPLNRITAQGREGATAWFSSGLGGKGVREIFVLQTAEDMVSITSCGPFIVSWCRPCMSAASAGG
jgi:dienelactone hydrolase